MNSLDLKLHKHILFAVDHYNPLNVLRNLSEAGLAPIVVLYGKSHSLIKNSRYLTVCHRVKTLEEGLSVILKTYGNEIYKPFIYTSGDDIQSFLDSHYDELKDGFHFFNAAGTGRVSYLQNKDVIGKIAEESGFIIPNSEVVDTGIMPKKLKYPIMTKVLSSTMGAWKGDVYVCKNEEELKEAYKKIKSPKLNLQEFLQKKNELCYEGFSINHGQDVFIPFVSEYIRCSGTSYGHYLSYNLLKEEETISKLKNLIKRTGFEGIFDVEFLVDKRGVKYFLEVNFRTTTWTYAVSKGGANLPYLWAKSTLQGYIDYNSIQLEKNTFTAMAESDDFLISVVKNRKVSLIQWISDMKSCKCLFYYDSKDKKPGYYHWFYVCSRFVLKKLHIIKS